MLSLRLRKYQKEQVLRIKLIEMADWQIGSFLLVMWLLGCHVLLLVPRREQIMRGGTMELVSFVGFATVSNYLLHIVICYTQVTWIACEIRQFWLPFILFWYYIASVFLFLVLNLYPYCVFHLRTHDIL